MFSNLSRSVRRSSFGRAVRGVLAAASVIVVFGITTGASCSNSSGRTSVEVPLEFMPREAEATPSVRLGSNAAKILVEPTVDARDEADKRVIGKNTENANGPLPVIAVGSTPAEFVTKVLRKQVRDAGVSVTEDMAVATRMLHTEIKGLELREDNSYHGEFRLDAKLVDPTGKEIWSDSFSGEGKNYGSSKSTENYNQTLSDAVKNATNKMLSDPKFKEALSGEPK